MTKHDSWVFVKANSPYEPIKHLFPEGFPVRDPFPLEYAKTPDGTFALWSIDVPRLSSRQRESLVNLIAQRCGTSPENVIAEMVSDNTLNMSHHWVEKIECGVEGITRQNELVQFQSRKFDSPEAEYFAFVEFKEQQYRDWIHGKKEPNPFPKSIDEIPANHRSKEVEEIIRMHNLLDSWRTAAIDGN